jgi:uncharacterized protein YndB with AHSA1/START domain
MSDSSSETLGVVVERDIPHPPEKIWRALSQPHLIAEWLMKNDFTPVRMEQSASGRSSGSPTREPRAAGGSSLRPWSR